MDPYNGYTFLRLLDQVALTVHVAYWDWDKYRSPRSSHLPFNDHDDNSNKNDGNSEIVSLHHSSILGLSEFLAPIYNHLAIILVA